MLHLCRDTAMWRRQASALWSPFGEVICPHRMLCPNRVFCSHRVFCEHRVFCSHQVLDSGHAPSDSASWCRR